MRQAAIDWLRGIGTLVAKHAGLVAVALSVATLLVLAVVIIPPLLAGGEDTENDVRSTLLQGLAGLFLGAGLYFTAQTLRHNRESAARTFELEREGQITERFTHAIDQLGNESLDVRLGGIYALERIAKSSAEDHAPILEVLTAYVREHTPVLRDKAASSADAPETDVQAVMDVLGRRERGRREHPLDLSSVDLRHARFGQGADERNFARAHFRESELERADLEQANLWEADFSEANLAGAQFLDANLMLANLTKANLREAILMRADLQGANFQEASLTRATLWYANLAGAKLVGANLTGAILIEANLTGADFMGAGPHQCEPRGCGLRLRNHVAHRL